MKIKYQWITWHPGLTHWGRVTHIYVSKQTIIIWTNAWILLIWPLGTNFSEILIEIYIFSFMKINFKLSSGIWRPFCLGLNVLINNEDLSLYVVKSTWNSYTGNIMNNNMLWAKINILTGNNHACEVCNVQKIDPSLYTDGTDYYIAKSTA